MDCMRTLRPMQTAPRSFAEKEKERKRKRKIFYVSGGAVQSANGGKGDVTEKKRVLRHSACSVHKTHRDT